MVDRGKRAGASEAHPEPCPGEDVFADGNPAEAQVSYVAGNVADDDGETTFSAHVTPGSTAGGWLSDQGFTDLWGAEHHFTVNEHGPLVAGHTPNMLHSYRARENPDELPRRRC